MSSCYICRQRPGVYPIKSSVELICKVCKSIIDEVCNEVCKKVKQKAITGK